MRTLMLSALAAAAVSAVSPAPASAAPGWTTPTAVQPGTDPVLSFSPIGAAALGSSLTLHGRVSAAEIDLAPASAGFAAKPRKLPAPSAGRGPEPLSGLALSSRGSLAASFADPAGPSPVLVRVAASTASFLKPFASAQTLVPLGSADVSQAAPDRLALVPTADGEIVGAGVDDDSQLSTAALAAGQTRFRGTRGASGLAASDDYALSADPAGNTYLAGDGAGDCTTVAFRAPHASFTPSYHTGNCHSATPNVFDAIAVTGGGRAGLLSEDVSLTGATADRLLIQVGRDGHFGSATQLGGVLGPTVGLAADADGELTAEWSDCVASPEPDGLLSSTDCAIDAATGSASTGFSPAAATGTPLVTPASGVTLSASTADRGIVVSRCGAGRCDLDGFTARPGGGFRAGVRFATAQRLISFTGDRHGDLLAVWLDPRGRLFAASARAATGYWSVDHLLSAAPVSAADVTAAYGPRGRAVVAWSRGNETYAASYSSSSGG